MSKRFRFTYPTDRPPRGGEEVGIRLGFEDFGGGVLVVARNEDTVRQTNLLYIKDDGALWFYPRQARDVGLDPRKADYADELRVLLEAAEHYKRTMPVGLCFDGGKWDAKYALDDAIKRARCALNKARRDP